MERKGQRNNQFLLIMTASIAALGGFLFGYDTGIISGALMFIQQDYPMSTFTQECVVSSVVLGALIGALFSGRLADHYGSKNMLLYLAILFIIGTLIATFAFDVFSIIAGRFIIGVAIGITSYISPLFISEMAPAKRRGQLVLLNGFMITSGEAIAFLVDYALVPSQSWRTMFFTGLLPAILLFFGMLAIPPSPRWLILKGEDKKARDVLGVLRANKDIEAEYTEITSLIKLEKGSWSELFSPMIKPVLLIGLGLGVLQQFVGINAVMYYGPIIFKTAGFNSDSSQIFATFCMGLINTIMSLIAVLIVDKVGRRRLLLTGTFIACISLGIIGALFTYATESPLLAWLTFAFMMVYIVGYSISLGSLFWLIISEIYPLNIRSRAMGFASAMQWAASFLITMSFLTILNTMGPASTFILFTLMCALSFWFSYYLVPETKGISLEHIEHNLRSGMRSRDLGSPINLLT